MVIFEEQSFAEKLVQSGLASYICDFLSFYNPDINTGRMKENISSIPFQEVGINSSADDAIECFVCLASGLFKYELHFPSSEITSAILSLAFNRISSQCVLKSVLMIAQRQFHLLIHYFSSLQCFESLQKLVDEGESTIPLKNLSIIVAYSRFKMTNDMLNIFDKRLELNDSKEIQLICRCVRNASTESDDFLSLIFKHSIMQKLFILLLYGSFEMKEDLHVLLTYLFSVPDFVMPLLQAFRFLPFLTNLFLSESHQIFLYTLEIVWKISNGLTPDDCKSFFQELADNGFHQILADVSQNNLLLYPDVTVALEMFDDILLK
jgi:hypothetical protein